MLFTAAAQLLSICFLFLACCVTHASDFLKNSSFDDARGDEPIGWFKACVPADGLKMYLDKSAEAGSPSVAIKNTHKYDKPVANNWMQEVDNIPRGRIVRLKSRIKMFDVESANVCIQCWNRKDEKLIAFASTPVGRGTQDWHEAMSESIAIPDSTDLVVVRAVLAGTGSVWFDNIQIEIDEEAEQRRSNPSSIVVDNDLKSMVDGEVIDAIAIDQDCMVLSYLPTWSHGNVDNIAVANNSGGVRTLLRWNSKSVQSLGDDRVIVALYARTVTAKGNASKIVIQPIADEWPEITSWNTKPTMGDANVSLSFDTKPGWKLFDVTELVKSHPQTSTHGIVLRFEKEDATGADWSGYAFVSREGIGEWKLMHPRVLIVKK